MSDDRPLAIDLFCGAGGLSLGFAQAGFNIVAAIDSDPVNASTYSNNFPSTKVICDDLSRLSAQDIRRAARLSESQRIDVVLGGPPCQGFSLIGKRDIADPRNQLLAEFCRLVHELSPRFFVMENVAGLMYKASRPILEKSLGRLRNGNYEWVLPLRILDAQDYGVPQRRRRVFVLGFRKGERPPQYPAPSKTRSTVWDAISDLRRVARRRTLLAADVFVGSLGTPSAYAKKLRVRSKGPVSGCRLCRHDSVVVNRFRKTRPGKTERISRFARLDKGRVAPTIRAGTPRSHGSFTAARPIHPTQPRCITVREAARLQSFPDWFAFHPTQWHGFQQVGNAVPPHLAHAVACGVLRALS
jgi:DNA (cytosine-5)-methyltransferase 1